jgi:hypothetical protein
MGKASLRVHVNPRSSRNQVTGWHDGILSVKLTAPPVEGAANKACVEFLANLLGVRKSQVVLISGDKSREKVFEIAGVSQDEISRRLAALSPCD